MPAIMFPDRKADTVMWEVCAGVNFRGDLPWFGPWLQTLAIILVFVLF